MNEVKCPYFILIADGGDDVQLQDYLEDPAHYPCLKYKYLRYPFDENFDVFYQKLGSVIARVNTTYTLLADNDDFYLLDRIPRLISFLEDNPDYVAARGRHAHLSVLDHQGHPSQLVSGDAYTVVVSDSPSIDSYDRIIRSEFLCRNMSKYDYYQNYYSVVRTGALLRVWTYLIALPVKEPLLIEILSHLMLVCEGKYYVGQDLFYIRQSASSDFGDLLVKNNGFLERSLSDGALSVLWTVVDDYIHPMNMAERVRILNALASWLQVYIVNIYNSNNPLRGSAFSFRSILKRCSVVRRCSRWVKHKVLPFVRPESVLTVREKAIIEPFVLSARSK